MLINIYLMYHTIFVCCLLLLYHDLKFSDKENALKQWAFKLNNALTAAETSHLNGKILKVISTGDR